ncbi:MAG TPA: VWA domain-containing protein [Pyrinomonadaceae bacterium]|nr:VWA domain-containing protein [Pyrinomonadaceae bacterium]
MNRKLGQTPPGVLVLAGLILAAFCAAAGGGPFGSALAFAGFSAAGQDSRPRRSSSAPTPAPTPVRRINQTPVQNQTPIRNQTVNRAPAPTPTPPRPLPGQIIPILTEPPPPPVLIPKATPTPAEDEIDEESTIKINTELVTLNVRVIDRNNRPIDNVRQNEFRVFENGVAQPIESFTREEVPISYGLAVDTSQSLRFQLQSVIDAGKTIVNSNKRGDETFLVRFISSDKIETLQDFTSNNDLLIDGLDNLYVEGGQTAIIDAVYLASEHVAQYKKGDDSDRRRRALIVITDGEDRASFYTQDKLFARLREEDVQIYVIGFVGELDKDKGLIRKSEQQKAINLINKLATETGGRAFFPQSISELPQIASEIVRDLRTQYVITYNPTNKARDGSYRAIKVAVEDGSSRDKRIALTRNGRMAPKGDTAPSRIPPPRATTRPTSGAAARP